MLSKSKVRLRINIKKVLTNEYPDLSYMKILAKCFACYLVNSKKMRHTKIFFNVLLSPYNKAIQRKIQ